MKNRLHTPKRSVSSIALAVAMRFCTFLTVGVAVGLVGYILVKGVPHLKLSMFSLPYTSENVSVIPSLAGTVVMVLISLAVALPFGIFAAIYLVEYAKRHSRVVKIISAATETLAGIPSIIYGLFGLLFFVTTLQWGVSVLAGGFTLAIMILPLVIRTTQEGLENVPLAYRKASHALGAGKLRTVFSVVLPAAAPSIVSGVMLAIGRILGETAALIYTAGTVAKVPTSLFDSSRTLSVHMYALSSEGIYMNEAYATATILLVLMVVIQLLSGRISKRLAHHSE